MPALASPPGKWTAVADIATQSADHIEKKNLPRRVTGLLCLLEQSLDEANVNARPRSVRRNGGAGYEERGSALPLRHSSQLSVQSPFCSIFSRSPPVLCTSTTSPGTEKS